MNIRSVSTVVRLGHAAFCSIVYATSSHDLAIAIQKNRWEKPQHIEVFRCLLVLNLGIHF